MVIRLKFIKKIYIFLNTKTFLKKNILNIKKCYLFPQSIFFFILNIFLKITFFKENNFEKNTSGNYREKKYLK